MPSLKDDLERAETAILEALEVCNMRQLERDTKVPRNWMYKVLRGEGNATVKGMKRMAEGLDKQAG